ncbi:carbonic anhydrase [Klebsormidium nitens]|uniref:Carbonic anhydrase n=1 Tax=Klebsormidium nitens TaxID=105231 RepID=A0A1Y1I5H7_KLENI|nr:carbonic anhydrase [Klebsormidium nitens]|eukprot:GAQ86205.1 carbonic anhydrase [Klebsormidium nitens]
MASRADTEGPVKYDEAQLKLLSLLVSKPELKDAAATKLAAVAEELEKTVSSDTGMTDVEAPVPVPRSVHHELLQKVPEEPSPIKKLKNGFVGFKSHYFEKESDLFEPLKTGQSPKVFIIACCDSRVSPDTIMSASPGEVFTLRNIANLVPPMEEAGKLHSTSAALEYAVLHLKVEHIIVKGHRACGGINALMTSEPDAEPATINGARSYIGDWMAIAAPARAKTLEECKGKDLDTQLRYCEKESVNNSQRNHI